MDLRWNEKIPALLLLAALLFVGFWPKSITTALNAELTRPIVVPQGMIAGTVARPGGVALARVSTK